MLVGWLVLLDTRLQLQGLTGLYGLFKTYFFIVQITQSVLLLVTFQLHKLDLAKVAKCFSTPRIAVGIVGTGGTSDGFREICSIDNRRRNKGKNLENYIKFISQGLEYRRRAVERLKLLVLSYDACSLCSVPADWYRYQKSGTGTRA